MSSKISRDGVAINPNIIKTACNIHPNVKETSIVSVPDMLLGQRIVACVLLNAGETITEKELLDFVTEKLPDDIILDRVLIFDDFPRTDGNSIDQELLQNQVNIRGHAWKFGKNIDTDAIIPARRCNTTDPRELARYCMEDADVDFVNKMRRGDLIVADSNFGCGSSREVAPLTIKAAGISAVIAKSFARIFFRNAINIGLPILECPEAVDGINEGDEIEVEPATGTIRNLTSGKTYQAQPFPEFLQRIIDRGGLLSYVEERLSQQR